MLLKWLIVSLIVYFIYRNYIAPPKISGGKDQQQQIRNEKDGTAEDGEYIDFEEVD